MQFETLEKQCQQETSSSSPSLYSQFSYDSLETNNNRRVDISRDSLNLTSTEEESEYYMTLKVEVPKKKNSNDSLLYNSVVFSGPQSPSSESEEISEVSRSFDNLKTWRSFDSLAATNKNRTVSKDKVSTENLSEDSGYGEITKSSSVNNLKENSKDGSCGKPLRTTLSEKRGSFTGFSPYDGEGFHEVSFIQT